VCQILYDSRVPTVELISSFYSLTTIFSQLYFLMEKCGHEITMLFVCVCVRAYHLSTLNQLTD